MAIADELYTAPALHKPSATGGPENTATPVESKPVTIIPDTTPKPTLVDTTQKPKDQQLSESAYGGLTMDPPPAKVNIQPAPAVDHVEFEPPASITNDKPAEPAAAPAKKSKTAKEVTAQTMDMMSEGLAHIKGMAEGGDPAIQAQFNSWLNKFATSSASSRSALMMNLRSQPGFVPGSGEGTAAMLMMARGTETTLAEMQSKMSIANLQFMADANKLGIEKAIQVKQFLNEQETHDLNNQINELSVAQGKLNLEQDAALGSQNLEAGAQTLELNRQKLLAGELDTLKDYGQYDKIADILNKKYPGLAVSSATIRSADPVTLNAMAGQKNAIAALVEAGNAEGAKQQAIGYYSQFWQNEGFRSQEEAVAYANKLDFSAAAFTARSTYIESTSTAVRNYAVRNDSSAGKAAVVDYYKAIGRDPSSVGGALTVDQVNEMRKYLDPAAQSVTDLAAEDKKQLGIDWEWYQQKKGAAGANTVGAVYNSFAEAAKNAGTPFDADQEKMVKAWVNQKLTYGDLASDASAPNGYTISDKATLLPWDDPKTSFYFTTWPKYDFSGAAPQLMDAGGQRYSSVNSTNYGANTAAEDKRLDDAYLAYMHGPSYDPTMTREKWYFDSKGGTVDPKANAPAVTPTSKESQAAFEGAVNSTAGGTETMKADLKSAITTMYSAYANAPATGQFPLSIGRGADFDAAGRRLKALGTLTTSMVRTDDTGGSKTYYGTKDFANYSLYVKMLSSGMKEAEAKSALTALAGPEAANAALALESRPTTLASSMGGAA